MGHINHDSIKSDVVKLDDFRKSSVTKTRPSPIALVSIGNKETCLKNNDNFTDDTLIQRLTELSIKETLSTLTGIESIEYYNLINKFMHTEYGQSVSRTAKQALANLVGHFDTESYNTED